MNLFGRSVQALISFTAVLLSIGAATALEGTTDWLIGPGRSVGPISLGMTEEELEARVGAPERTSLGAWEYLSSGYAVLFNDESRTVSAVLAGGGTEQLRPDKRFHGSTVERLGMGSTEQEILEALGEPSSQRLTGDSLHLTYSHLGIEFMLNRDAVNWLAVRPAT